LQLLFLSQDFSNGTLVPPWRSRKLFSVGHVQRASRGYEQRQRSKLGIFTDEQGAASVESRDAGTVVAQGGSKRVEGNAIL